MSKDAEQVLLENNLTQILNEKTNKIIPGNIKKDVQILGVTGILEEGIDTSDADAMASELYTGKTAYVNGTKITGTNSLTDTIAGGTLTELNELVGNILGNI